MTDPSEILRMSALLRINSLRIIGNAEDKAASFPLKSKAHIRQMLRR